MQTKQIYYDDPYKKSVTAKVVDVETNISTALIVLDKTIFYPEGGGQPSDQGVIKGKDGELLVQQVLLKGDEIIHIGKLTGQIKKGESVDCLIDWERRFKNMRVHTAGHVIHDAVMQIFGSLVPLKAEHGKKPYLEYEGHLEPLSAGLILQKANEIINSNLPVKLEFVSLDELKKRANWIPPHLPSNKPLRIMQIGDLSVIPDGGTQLKSTGEVEEIASVEIQNENDHTFVYYRIPDILKNRQTVFAQNTDKVHTYVDNNEVINVKNQAIAQISQAKDNKELEEIRLDLFGKNGKFTSLLKSIKDVPFSERGNYGATLNDAKNTLEEILLQQKNSLKENVREWFDPTLPGIEPQIGKTHFITRAIEEIAEVFEKIGFTRVRYPEVEWDYFAFAALNFPENHPARDDWETFFINEKDSPKYGPMLLTPHTSSGQIREMLSNKPPIRMINIAKTYRRQIDAKHYPMFHQFEGLVVDKNISIVNLKGTFDYFVKAFFGQDRNTRLRPYHFQFTEPSFEIDISCNVCNGTGIVNAKNCKLCKEGWLELGGAGMVHPNVLSECGLDYKIYSGFAFGWGVERTYMMKSGLSIPDLRLIYSDDIRILKQI